jgi:hypothetical protein
LFSAEADLCIYRLPLAGALLEVFGGDLLAIRSQVCESIAFRGILSSKNLVKLSVPLYVEFGGLSCVAIRVNVHTLFFF